MNNDVTQWMLPSTSAAECYIYYVIVKCMAFNNNIRSIQGAVYKIEIRKLWVWSTQVLSGLNPVDTHWLAFNYPELGISVQTTSLLSPLDNFLVPATVQLTSWAATPLKRCISCALLLHKLNYIIYMCSDVTRRGSWHIHTQCEGKDSADYTVLYAVLT